MSFWGTFGKVAGTAALPVAAPIIWDPKLSSGAKSIASKVGNALGGQMSNPYNREQIAAQQAQLTNQLQSQAAGNGPSAAQNQLQQAMQQAMLQQMGVAGTYQGSANPMLAQRNLANNLAGLQLGVAGDAATLRAKEQLAAQEQLQQLLAQQAGVGNQIAQQNAQGWNKLAGGLVQGVGTGLSMALMA